ncbi:hypothetical protein F5Y04DRAFT_253834 [Hypomontagnella monticulosa]|nr:hypothetical protein F5Y04DRAFT_253834 [Hypomontagnella monticulosa]
MSQTLTQTVTEPSTTGKIYMWSGTTDGKDGKVNVHTGSTNILPYHTVDVTVKDMRALSPRPTVLTHGYEFLQHPSSIPHDVFMNFSTPENKKILSTKYFEECNDLVKKVTNAAEAYTFVHRIRSENTDPSKALDLMQQNRHGGTVPAAHCDRDPITAPERLRSSLGEELANELMKKYKRWAAVNIWRPIVSGVQRWPLCLVNHQGVPDWNYDTHMGRLYIVEDDLIDIRGDKDHESILKYDPRYEYHYASNMKSDEVLVFCAFHSDPKFGTPHGAFWDSATTPESPDRVSIEVRTWAFFED